MLLQVNKSSRWHMCCCCVDFKPICELLRKMECCKCGKRTNLCPQQDYDIWRPWMQWWLGFLFAIYLPSSEPTVLHLSLFITHMILFTLLFPRVGRLCIICEPSFNTGVYSLVVRAAEWCIWKVTGPNPTRVQIWHNEHFCLYLSLMSL